MLWNQLPNEAKLAESLHSFKSIVGQRHASKLFVYSNVSYVYVQYVCVLIVESDRRS